jgi:hypothetical protein
MLRIRRGSRWTPWVESKAANFLLPFVLGRIGTVVLRGERIQMRERRVLEQLRRWRQAALWAPIVWFPLAIYALIVGSSTASIGIGLAGIVFAGLARGVVLLARCPRCETLFRDSPGGFRRVWDDASCEACSLSLFDLRRGGDHD